MKRFGKIIRIVLNLVLIAAYFIMGYNILSMFSFIPWYDENGGFLLKYVALWIPICVLTIIIVSSFFIMKRVYRARIILLCINAVFIPLVYFLSEAFHLILGAVTLITMLAYVIIFIYGLTNDTV